MLRIGTRGSALARWQAEWVAARLRESGCQVELIEIATHGDRDRSRSVEEIGTRGVFTKEIQRALLAGDVDLGVHSLKDLPTEPVDGLVLAAVPPRESPADVLVTRAGSGEQGAGRTEKHSVLYAPCSLLAEGALVGTGSLRRQAQLRHVRPDLLVADIRGNVDTRLRKLDDGEFDAVVLAEAGLRRLGFSGRISEVLPFDMMLPAVGQGALALECRANDAATLEAIVALDDAETHASVAAERALLAALRGGCMAPVGAWGRTVGDELMLSAVVLSADGTQKLEVLDRQTSHNVPSAEELGQRVAASLLEQGAAKLIAQSRSGFPAWH
jgi:hydroxymethylbilane synthase